MLLDQSVAAVPGLLVLVVQSVVVPTVLVVVLALVLGVALPAA